MSQRYITREGDMLDAICWAQYGRTSGIVEQVLEANRGLADIGPVLPAGVEILLPDLAAPVAAAQPARLWD